jgi:hypothetical protein
MSITTSESSLIRSLGSFLCRRCHVESGDCTTVYFADQSRFLKVLISERGHAFCTSYLQTLVISDNCRVGFPSWVARSLIN